MASEDVVVAPQEESLYLESNDWVSSSAQAEYDDDDDNTSLHRRPIGFSRNIGRRVSSKRAPIPPPPRATPSSSSGYPGVSWNKRMGAWLAFYYDNDTRRSRTFHPKYYDMDVEKAKLAAIEFMKSIEKHPRCSLRKTRREKDMTNNAFDIDKYGYRDLVARTRRRCTSQILKNTKSPLTSNPNNELYDFDALKRNFMIAASQKAVDVGYLPEVNYMPPNQIYKNPWQQSAGEYFSPKFGMPFFETTDPTAAATLTYSSPPPNRARMQNPYFDQDPSAGNMYINRIVDFEAAAVAASSAMSEDSEIHRLMASIAPSPSESFEHFRPLNPYDPIAGINPFGSGQFGTPLGSPYLSPCAHHAMYTEQQLSLSSSSQVNDQHISGFQHLIAAEAAAAATNNQQPRLVVQSPSPPF